MRIFESDENPFNKSDLCDPKYKLEGTKSKKYCFLPCKNQFPKSLGECRRDTLSTTIEKKKILLSSNVKSKPDYRCIQEKRRKSLLDLHIKIREKDCFVDDLGDENFKFSNADVNKEYEMRKTTAHHESGKVVKYGKVYFNDNEIRGDPIQKSSEAKPANPSVNTINFPVVKNKNKICNRTLNKQQFETYSDKKTRMIKRLSYPLTLVDGLTAEVADSLSANMKNPDFSLETALPSNTKESQSVFSKVFLSSPITLVSELGGNLFSKSSSEDSVVPSLLPFKQLSVTSGKFGRSSVKNSLTEIEPSINKSSIEKLKCFDKSFFAKSPLNIEVDFSQNSENSVRESTTYAVNDAPLFLHLFMGKPIGKEILLPPISYYGEGRLLSEYCFSVPRNKVKELYNFVNTWVENLYGELDVELIQSRGFELMNCIDHSQQEAKEEKDRDFSKLRYMSKKFHSRCPLKNKEQPSVENDFLSTELLVPELIGSTEILLDEHLKLLCDYLPARAEGYSWSLVFSTSQNGFSLNSLYRKMNMLESPILIAIKDTENNVFGGLTSCAMHVSDHFYGTGESFLYKFNPMFKVFHWTGENVFFIKGNPESLSLGAGDGCFGLWLDGDLNLGRSQTCRTYGNEPLSPQEDFVIKNLECWAFI